MKVILSLLFTFSILVSYSQDNSNIGIDNLERNSYIRQIADLEPQYYRRPNPFTAIKLSQAYYRIRQYEKAIYYNELAIQLDSTQPVYYIDYFNLLREFGESETARKVAMTYLEKFGSDIVLSKLDSSELYTSKESNYEVVNLSSNTKYDEYGMYPLFNDFKIVNSNLNESANPIRPTIKDLMTSIKSYITVFDPSEKSVSNYFKLFTRKNGTYDVISCYDPIEKRVYITSNVPVSSMEEESKVSNSASLKIVIADIDTNMNITNFRDFQHNSENFSVGHPYISNDGELLYFMSNKPGGYGGSDLYMCVKLLDGNWGAPMNLGNIINTSEDELYPYCSPAGALYFSSAGHSLFGGLDIVKSYRSRSNIFSKPENLGVPINSNRDDFAFCFLDKYGTEGFFTSNRADGAGGADIYRFNYFSRKVCKDPIKNFTIVVKDKKTKEPLPNVHLKMTIRADGKIHTGTTDLEGKLELLVDGCNDFDVEATRDFYLNNGFYYDGFKKLVNIELDKKELNNIIELESIYYDVGKYELPSISQGQIEKLAGLLSRNPDIKVELSSHTDSRGDEILNNTLSQKRAESIVHFLVGKGISSSRLSPKGYGESRLINNCADGVQCSEYDHGKNRRTEFRIVEIGGKSVNLGADNSNTTRADDSNNSDPAPKNSGRGFRIE